MISPGAIVLVVHLCTVIPQTPFLKNCDTKVIPKKSVADCEAGKRKWLGDKDLKHYFRDDRKTFSDGQWALVAEPHCEKDPEAGFIPVEENVKVDGQKT